MLRTKIVSTVGPATAAQDKVHALAELGVDVIRLNFAHGNHDTHRQVIHWAREAAEACGRSIAVLADLAGPKIRIGALPAPVDLGDKSTVVIAPEGEHRGDELPTTYHDLARDVRPGDRILLDDGLMELRVDTVRGARVHCTVVRGGILQQNKGLNLPGVRVSAPSLTEKDIDDLEFAVGENVDYIGLSFVQRALDVTDLRRRLPPGTLIVAKIEKDTALEQLESILAATDAVMVARGDLGVELPFEQVPIAQKRIIQLANLYGRPVITATQMLESMMQNPRPTRAEASDVANALFDGTDAVMLSGETAAGKYPFLAVDAMVRIASEIERTASFEEGPKYDMPMQQRLRIGATPTEHAIAAATVEAVRLLGAPAVVSFTRTGGTTRLISSYRPPVPILGVCDQVRTWRQLALVWGVHPVLCQDDVNYASMLECARDYLFRNRLAEPGQRVVVTAGVPFHVAGTTNMLRVEEL
ncbi:MAG TPA: pyruvate kinase [Longimicrobiales bacterium]|nr:pyruvate kinase [Longimicrobiales bacterium]